MNVRHEMSERLEDCLLCEMKGTLYRIPQFTNIVKKEEQSERKTGSLVKEFIEESRETLKEQKKERIDYNE
jgi:hypothetical protein